MKIFCFAVVAALSLAGAQPSKAVTADFFTAFNDFQANNGGAFPTELCENGLCLSGDGVGLSSFVQGVFALNQDMLLKLDPLAGATSFDLVSLTGTSLGTSVSYLDSNAAPNDAPSTFGALEGTQAVPISGVTEIRFLLTVPPAAVFLFEAEFTLNAAAPPQPAPIPLPASAWFLAGGLLALLSRRRT